MYATIRVVSFVFAFSAMAAGVALAQESEPNAAGDQIQKAISPETIEAAPKTQFEQSADDLLKEFIKSFDDAIKSLDNSSNALGRAVELQDYEGVIAEVDQLLAKVNAVADRVRPESTVVTRSKKIIADIDALATEIKKNDSLSEDFRRGRLDRLADVKGRIEKDSNTLATAFDELRGLAEDLKRVRREVAYDVIIDAYTKAADSLSEASSKVTEIISKLKNYIKQFKEPLTQ